MSEHQMHPTQSQLAENKRLEEEEVARRRERAREQRAAVRAAGQNAAAHALERNAKIAAVMRKVKADDWATEKSIVAATVARARARREAQREEFASSKQQQLAQRFVYVMYIFSLYPLSSKHT